VVKVHTGHATLCSHLFLKYCRFSHTLHISWINWIRNEWSILAVLVRDQQSLCNGPSSLNDSCYCISSKTIYCQGLDYVIIFFRMCSNCACANVVQSLPPGTENEKTLLLHLPREFIIVSLCQYKSKASYIFYFIIVAELKVKSQTDVANKLLKKPKGRVCINV